MVSQSVLRIPNDSLSRIAAEMFSKVPRNRIQQALADSRVISRSDEPQRFRQVSTDADSWLDLIRSSQTSEQQALQLVRLLSPLAEIYVRTSPPAIRSAFEEARRAAERLDSGRFWNQLEKVDTTSNEAHLNTIEDWAALLWLRTASENTKERISELSGWHEQSLLGSPGNEQLAQSEQGSATVLDPALANSSDDAPIVKLLELLHRLASPPVAPDWSLVQIADAVAIPPAEIALPDLSALDTAMTSLRERLRMLIGMSTWEVGLATLPESVDSLAILAGAGIAAQDLATKIESTIESSRERIRSAIALVDQSLTEDRLAVESFGVNHQQWAPYIASAKELVANNHALLRRALERCLKIGSEIEAAAACLTAGDQEQLGLAVKSAIRDRNIPALQTLKEGVDIRSSEIRSFSLREAEIAQKTLDAIRENSTYVDDQFALACFELFSEGKSQMAYNLLASFFRANADRRALDDHRSEPNALSRVSDSGPTANFIARFRPRDPAIQDSSKPVDATDLGRRLYARAIAALSADSTVNFVDNALDLLVIATEGGPGCADFAYAALTLLALPRPEFGSLAGWGARITSTCPSFDEACKPELLNASTMVLLQRRSLDEFLAERFAYSEVIASIDILFAAICRSATNSTALEDLAFACGNSGRFSDNTYARSFIDSLVRNRSVPPEATAQVNGAIERALMGTSKPNLEVPALRWVESGIRALHSGLRLKRAIRGDSGMPKVSVPVSVKSSGGYAYSNGQAVVDVALLVSNPSRDAFSIVELVIARSANPWLLEDVLAHIGPMASDDKILVPVSFDLVGQLSTPGTLSLECRLVFKDPSKGGRTRYSATSLDLPIRMAQTAKMSDYPGANSRPLILEGDVLERSPSSVKRSLEAITAGLLKDGVGAMLFGRRRRGKTSVLRTLEQNVEVQRLYCVIFDSIEYRPFESFGTVIIHLAEVLDQVVLRLDLNITPLRDRINSNSEPWACIQSWLGDLREHVSQPTRVLLLLDEFQKWLSRLTDTELGAVLGVFRGLRNIPVSEKISFSFVLSGLTNLRAYAKASNDFRNSVEYYELKPFNKDEAEALIRANSTIEFDRRALSRIRDLSGGNPFLINLLCQDVVEELRGVNRCYCLLGDIEYVIAKHLERGEDSKVWRYLEYLLRKDEEDHGSQIAEYPTIVALAAALRQRSLARGYVSLEDIEQVLRVRGLACDLGILQGQLATALSNELIEEASGRFTIATGWLCEWLGHGDRLLPVGPADVDGLVLNRFRMGSKISAGGQSDVYEAFDLTKGNARVILKIYRPVGGSRSSLLFDREAKVLYLVNHPGVVTLIEHDVDDERGNVLVLKPVPGQTLGQLIASGSAIAKDLVGKAAQLGTQVRFLQELSEALWSCHVLGIVHKDVTPNNVMVREDSGTFRPVLIDFGLASHPDDGLIEITSAHFTMGYAAPEKHRGMPRRAPADVYGLGLIAYELITGKFAFPGSALQCIQAQSSFDFEPVLDARGDVPQKLAVLIESMLHVDPSHRPDAITVSKGMATALVPDEWRDFARVGMQQFANDSLALAYESLSKAVFAVDADLRSPDFVDALETLASVAGATAKLGEIAQPLMKRFCESAIVQRASFPVTAASSLLKEFTSASLDARSKHATRCAIECLCAAVESNGPIVALCDILEALMNCLRQPPFWDSRHELFLLFDSYRSGRYLSQERLGFWCVEACGIAHGVNANHSECQLWLQRAETLGVRESDPFASETRRLAPLIESVGSISLPAIAPQEEAEKVIGSDEQGHYDVKRIVAWAKKVQRLYPWVLSVRRVRGDGNIAPFPTRLLGDEAVPRHTKNLPEVLHNLVIPAVLDASYSVGADRALRINIVLPVGTTAGQRDVAFRSLRENRRLFPEEC